LSKGALFNAFNLLKNFKNPKGPWSPKKAPVRPKAVPVESVKPTDTTENHLSSHDEDPEGSHHDGPPEEDSDDRYVRERYPGLAWGTFPDDPEWDVFRDDVPPEAVASFLRAAQSDHSESDADYFSGDSL